MKVMKSMSKDETEYINQIVGLRRQQELFQEDLQTRNAEYDRLQVILGDIVGQLTAVDC